jgi:hypothetical protein
MIHQNEIRRFDNQRFEYREPPHLNNTLISSTNLFRCVAPDGGMEVRAEPYPNPCKPPSAGGCWFSKEEWVQGTLVERGAS